jgi:enolase
MIKIKKITAQEILDSRGNPTVKATVMLSDGTRAQASVPSGASTGKFEALELRDNDKDRYQGKGVLKAVRNVNEQINQELVGKEPFDQRKIDWLMNELDGSENKSKLGANAILAVSLAVARVAAISRGLDLYEYIAQSYDFTVKNFQLPLPFFNIFNGGQHAQNGLSVQEFMMVPIAEMSYKDRLRMGAEIYHSLKDLLHKNDYATGVGDEGGFAPSLSDPKEVLEIITRAGVEAGYEAGSDFAFALDVAASEFCEEEDGKYIYRMQGFDSLDSKGLSNYLLELTEKFPIMSIEDPLDQEDWDGWHSITKRANDIQIVGDDLFVTNTNRLKKGIDKNVGNSILIKLNQIGSLSETIDAIKLAHENNYKTMISHRSGETCDSFIADLVVGTGARQIKSGSLARSERISKYNRLLEIELQLEK